MPKLITDVVLKKNIENILTELVNSTFDWQEYTDSEISDILEITDEQAMELTKIINDQIIANNKLWSSSKTDAEIKNALIESNKYADELIGQISSISLEYVTTLPTSDIKSNVIYILQGSPNTLNVYNESTSSFVSVGDLDLDLSGYYTKTEVDNLLADKADDNTVVHTDDVVQDLTTTSGTTVLSSAGLETELDKKFDKSGILSSISSDISTLSNEKVLSEKAIKTELDKKIDKTSILTSFSSAPSDEQVFSGKYIKGIFERFSLQNRCTHFIGDLNTIEVNSVYNVEGSKCANTPVSHWGFVITMMHVYVDTHGAQIFISMQNAGGQGVYMRIKDSGIWNAWRKIDVDSKPEKCLDVHQIHDSTFSGETFTSNNDNACGCVFTVPLGVKTVAFDLLSDGIYCQFGRCSKSGTLPTIITTGAERIDFGVNGAKGTYEIGGIQGGENIFIGGNTGAKVSNVRAVDWY